MEILKWEIKPTSEWITLTGLKLLYSRTTETTVAPLGPSGEVYDFYPLIEFMRKNIHDELPMYTLFILIVVIYYSYFN